MNGSAQARLLADGRRLHLQHGPIDIIARAFGAVNEVHQSYSQAETAFSRVLEGLVSVLPLLRERLDPANPALLSGVAADMQKACLPFAKDHFVTPMAAVAGAVADHVLQAMTAGRTLKKAYVNNGGDIALYLAPGQTMTVAVVDNQDAPSLDAGLTLAAADGIGGVATSGWRGRSLSPGIADAVTVLAANSAAADVAATLIAGAVMTRSPAIEQVPATSLRDDTDLGDMLVTTNVGPLNAKEKEDALSAGYRLAQQFRQRGLIRSAYLSLQKEIKVLDHKPDQKNWRIA